MLDRFKLKDDYKYCVEKYRNNILIDNFAGLYYAQNNLGLQLKNLYLLSWENLITIPLFFDIEFIKQFKGLITYNKLFYQQLKPELEKLGKKCYFLEYSFLNNEYYTLDTFIPYENKIKGIACLNRIYFPPGNIGNIIYLRELFMDNIHFPIKHAYGGNSWGNPSKNVFHQNIKTDPYSCDSLKIRNRYLFNFCPETLFHPFWSNFWCTERIFNCFKAKTVPIYIGCYNIEEIVPKEFFIDLRQYIINENYPIQFDYKRIENDLMKLGNNKQKYLEMIEEAYLWQKKNKFGDFLKTEKALDEIVAGNYNG
jgi:hypothetical protein